MTDSVEQSSPDIIPEPEVSAKKEKPLKVYSSGLFPEKGVEESVRNYVLSPDEIIEKRQVKNKEEGPFLSISGFIFSLLAWLLILFNVSTKRRKSGKAAEAGAYISAFAALSLGIAALLTGSSMAALAAAGLIILLAGIIVILVAVLSFALLFT